VYSQEGEVSPTPFDGIGEVHPNSSAARRSYPMVNGLVEYRRLFVFVSQYQSIAAQITVSSWHLTRRFPSREHRWLVKHFFHFPGDGSFPWYSPAVEQICEAQTMLEYHFSVYYLK
jgi:hypothetical protein